MTIFTHRQDKKSKVVNICWIALTLHFLFSGLLRGFVFPQFSDYIFFVPLPLILCLFTLEIYSNSKIRFFDFFCILVSLLALCYQAIMFLGGSINFQTAVYGWFLYGLPMLGMAIARQSITRSVVTRIINLFELSLIPNLFFCIMQTIVGNSLFFSAGFGEGLVSSNGVQRATGTFSSPAGYALYLALSAALLLVRRDLDLIYSKRRIISLAIVIFQLPISGSRTAILSVILVFAVRLVIRLRYGIRESKREMTILRSFAFLFGLYISGWVFSKSSTVTATSARFISANETDPPLTRILAQVKINMSEIELLSGSGLGSRANGVATQPLDWVEFDFQRIMLESGFVIGSIFLIFRILLVIRLLKPPKHQLHRLDLPLISAVVPILLFGQFMGQGTISAGTWLGLYILDFIRFNPYLEADCRNFRPRL